MKIENLLPSEALKEVYLYTLYTDEHYMKRLQTKQRWRMILLLVAAVIMFLIGIRLSSYLILAYCVFSFFYFPIRLKKHIENAFNKKFMQLNKSNATKFRKIELKENLIHEIVETSEHTTSVYDIFEILEIKSSYIIKFNSREDLIIFKDGESMQFIQNLRQTIENNNLCYHDNSKWEWKFKYWA